MREWAADVGSLLGDVRRGVRKAAGAVRGRFSDDPVEVLAYRGYGTGTRAHVYGRTVEKRGVSLSTDADSTLRNLLNTYRRAEADPLAHASVAVELAGTRMIFEADDEGFFGGWMEFERPLDAAKEWHECDMTLLSPGTAEATDVRTKGETLVPTASARFGVISDIDDTVIQSRISNFLQAARTVMLGNARTRLPFAGVAAFYRALRNGAGGDEKNPVFYVSSGPWNIYDVITEFMDIQEIPSGPVLLRDWDIALRSLSSERHFEHKGLAIRSIMHLYPHMEFILIGDTSQHDPEIYHRIVHEFPRRIRAIYIRDVTRNAARSASVQALAQEVLAAHSALVLSEDTLGAASHAAEHGWIRMDALPDVRDEKRADEGRDGKKVAAPDGGEPSSGAPATVIE